MAGSVGVLHKHKICFPGRLVSIIVARMLLRPARGLRVVKASTELDRSVGKCTIMIPQVGAAPLYFGVCYYGNEPQEARGQEWWSVATF